MKTKEQTNQEILDGAAKDNNETSEIRIRHTESAHPIDCSCGMCPRVRFNKEDENKVKEELEWYTE